MHDITSELEHVTGGGGGKAAWEGIKRVGVPLLREAGDLVGGAASAGVAGGIKKGIDWMTGGSQQQPQPQPDR